MKTTRVKVVAVCEEKDVQCWPYINYDHTKPLYRIMAVVEGNNPNMKFDVVSVCNVDQVKATYEEDVKIYDGVLVLTFTCWKGVDLFYARQSKNGIPRCFYRGV